MEIKDIITEELKNILKEGYVMEHDNFKFKQKIVKPSFYNFQSFSNDYDVDVIEHDIYANWRIGFWLNDMGVEKFIIQVDSVEGTYKVEMRDKQSDEIAQEIDKNIGEIPWRFQVDDTAILKGGSLYISDMEFNFDTKICDVEYVYQEQEPM